MIDAGRFAFGNARLRAMKSRVLMREIKEVAAALEEDERDEAMQRRSM